MDYDELVQKNIAGEISDLEFLLAQEELAQAYQEEMAAKQQETNNQTAREWLLDYVNSAELNTMPIPAKDVLQKIGKTAMREWKKQGDYFTRDNMLSSDEILRQCIG